VGYLKRGGKVWIRVFPDKPITKKPPEVTMGGGKGDVDHYAFPLKKGRVIYEIDGVSEEMAIEALKRASYKMPVKTKNY
jgi:large subunit ribosomal protein L16